MQPHKVFLWMLYHPFRKTIRTLSLSSALNMGTRLGNLEYFVYQKRNQPFHAYMARMLAKTPHAKRINHIIRGCFQYRHRNFILRMNCSKYNERIPVKDVHYIPVKNNKGVCFPMVHFGFFYSGFSALGRTLSDPLYTVSIMKKRNNGIDKKFSEIKKESIEALSISPLFDISQLKSTCLPALINGTGNYVPTFDAVTKSSKAYPFLGDKIILSIHTTAAFCARENIPIVPFFTVGDDWQNSQVLLAPPYDDFQSDRSIASIESWYVSVLEKFVLNSPGLVDWFYWWKNTLRFKQRFF